MSYREVSVIEVREILRLWLAGRGLREVARLTALGESPQVCSLKFPTCERLSVYRLAGSGGGAAQSLGGGVVVA
jgi:hypothetical protein